MGKVYVFDHPLIQHKTAMLRMKETSTKDFRELVNEIGLLMGFEATRDLELDRLPTGVFENVRNSKSIKFTTNINRSAIAS